MTLTKKHFKAMAEILNYHYKTCPTDECERILEMARHFSEYFKTENPLFDGNKFMEAVKNG